MPEMDGIEFARQIRSMHWANHIPIVMITSESGDDKRQSAYDRARITCYITKPFTVEEIHAKLIPVIKDVQVKHQKRAEEMAASKAPAKPASGFFSRLMQ